MSDEDKATYKIVRGFRDHDFRETIATGLTLDEAKEHCNNPETSSRTARSQEAQQRTDQFGPWFDRFEEE